MITLRNFLILNEDYFNSADYGYMARKINEIRDLYLKDLAYALFYKTPGQLNEDERYQLFDALSKEDKCAILGATMEVLEDLSIPLTMDHDAEGYPVFYGSQPHSGRTQIAYDTQYGDDPSSVVYTFGMTMTQETLPTLTAEGYVHTGWVDYFGDPVKVGDTFECYPILTAVWEEASAPINISFNGKEFIIDAEVLATAKSVLKDHLSSTMNGSGATINFDGTSYGIDSTKLSNATNKFVAHLGTISGEGYSIIINGVAYPVDAAKLSDAISSMDNVLNELQSGGEEETTCSTCGGVGYYECEECAGTGTICSMCGSTFGADGKCFNCGVEAELFASECSNCNGLGKVVCTACIAPVDCPDCGGTGNIYCAICGTQKSEVGAACPNCGDHFDSYCNTCDGTGKVFELPELPDDNDTARVITFGPKEDYTDADCCYDPDGAVVGYKISDIAWTEEELTGAVIHLDLMWASIPCKQVDITLDKPYISSLYDNGRMDCTQAYGTSLYYLVTVIPGEGTYLYFGSLWGLTGEGDSNVIISGGEIRVAR